LCICSDIIKPVSSHNTQLIGIYNSNADTTPITEVKLEIDTVVDFLGSKDDDDLPIVFIMGLMILFVINS
jgi:hypothetical protein